MNKPLGIICSKKDDRGRKTIFELLPKKNSLKWVLIGRLDVNTSGLILFTDQGDFANQLMHPSSSLERVYRVRVFGENADSAAEKLCKGVTIEKQTLSFLRCERVSPAKDAVNNWFEVTVKTGQYRMVRRLWQSQGLRVSRLVRVSYAGICLPKSLAQGQTCLVDEQTVDRLKGLVGA
jgi:23S rRNA pseudouridine2605 synthase